jgi:flagellar biosynthesis/type III secretory pathway protein FliH
MPALPISVVPGRQEYIVQKERKGRKKGRERGREEGRKEGEKEGWFKLQH